MREENSSLPACNAALGIDIYSFKILLVAFLLQPQGTTHIAAQPSLFSHVHVSRGDQMDFLGNTIKDVIFL